MDLSQALRNAIEVERAAARFYRNLVVKAADERTRAFLEKMACEEDAHSALFLQQSKELVEGKLPDWTNMEVAHVEGAPDWQDAEHVSYSEALQIALEAEQSAEFYYDALADSVPPGEVRDFFRRVAKEEARHSEVIKAIMKKGG